ncbi:hypothetical protein EMCRGX_G021936 [Ephydatia muelleri]
MANLWVEVRTATVDCTEECSVYSVVRVEEQSHTTRKANGPKPQWNETFHFSVQDCGGPLVLELHRPGFFSSTLFGQTTIPMYTLRHSDKPGTGWWCCLFHPQPDGSLRPTKHQLHVDARFELPKDLPSEVREELEAKLEKFGDILEKEAEVMEKQYYLMVTGGLDLPRSRPTTPVSEAAESTVLSTSTLSRKESNPSRDESARNRKESTPNRKESTPNRKESTPNRDESAPNRNESTPNRKESRKESTPNGNERAPSRNESAPSRNESAPSKKESAQTNQDQPSVQKMHKSLAIERWRKLVNHSEFKLLVSSFFGFMPMIFLCAQVKRRLQAQGKWARKGMLGKSALIDLVKQLQGAKRINQLEAHSGKNVTAFCTKHHGYLTRANTAQETRRRVRGRRLIDEEVRLIVYQRAIEALLYPFESWNAMKPTYCSECGSFMWGLMKQGVKCTQCGQVCHERCSSLLSQECFAGYNRRSSMHDRVRQAISTKMHKTKQNNEFLFKLLREAFDIQSDDHDRYITTIEQKILSLTSNFEAVVEVNVLAAEGLNLQALSDTDRRIYVSWTEKFVFRCNNYHEPIQVRVWNERDNAISKIQHALTKEGDIFLGQKIIEVRRIGPPHDVWYKLDKRTESVPVSGSIKLNVSVYIEGENVKVPLQEQYTKLHEQLFLYSHYTNDHALIDVPSMPTEGEEDKLKFLPPAAQQVVDEFALRYSIENLFRSMIHMQLLVNHYTLPKALVVMANLLKNIQYQIFTHIAEDNSIRGIGATKLLDEHLEAINFGRDRFAKLLDKLMATLRLDLQRYREVFPAHDSAKLEDLKHVCELMKAVVLFQMQGFQATSAVKLPEMIRDSMTANLKDTFDFIVQNSVPPNTSCHPGLSKEGEPFHFFYEVLENIRSVVYEDTNVYHPHIASVCDFNLGEVSAIELWKLFGSLIGNLFESEENSKLFQSSAYLDLLFHIKNFYQSVVGKAASRAGIAADYPRWFVPCVKLWMQETEQKAMTYVGNAWNGDIEAKFQSYQGQPFSASVFDMFFLLHKVLEYLVSIETDTEDDIKAIYHHDYALLTCAVLGDYLKKINSHIPTCTTEPKQKEAYMLVCNIHTMRIRLQELYEEIGGSEHAGQKCSETLHQFQNTVLGKELNSVCKLVAASSKNDIIRATTEVQNTLIRATGQGASCKQDGLTLKEESRAIIEPLMNAITKVLQNIASVVNVKPCDGDTTCAEQIVLHKLVKEVWTIVLESIQAILLPSSNPECAILQCACCNYSQRHCALFDVMLEVVKDFFSSDMTGLKQPVVESNIKRLKTIVGLYRKTTENLIADYISAEAPKEAVNGGDTFGEVAIEVSTQIHPTTGELDGQIRVVSASNLKTFQSAGTLRIGIEVNLIVSYAQGSKKFVTAQKTGTSSPSFCETFEFVLKEVSTPCELQITVKQHSGTIFKNDRIIGVAVVLFADLMAEAKQTVWLSSCLNMSANCSILFAVLSQRATDDAAVKEFVALKTQKRSQDDSTPEKSMVPDKLRRSLDENASPQ